jgi:hypothetical protein
VSLSDNYRLSDAVDTPAAATGGAREIPSWAISLLAHIGVLALMGSITYVTADQEDDTLITSVTEEYDEREYKFDVTVADVVGNDSTVNTLAASQAAAKVVQRDPSEQMEQQLDSNVLVPEAPPINDISQPPEADLTSVVETSGASEKTGGVEGSLDRMTFEIMNSLKERQTLVVWLFDESGSLAARRNDIADRFSNIYGQLDSLKAQNQEGHLKTAIVGFGQGLNFYTPEPTTDVNAAVNLVRSIKNDDSGKEYVFGAVGEVVKKWRKFRSPSDKHNCMIVVVTDERGDDYGDGRLEAVAAYCSKMNFKVYTIGNASPFGREKGYVRYTYKDGFQDDIPVDQGPESVKMEVVDLPFWGGRRVASSRISSGQGPYALTRLCAETGGLYLITQDTAGPNFDSFLMKDYMPDYRPIRKYMEDVNKSVTKQALIAAAEATQRTRVIAPTLRFRADTDNALRIAAGEAQRPAAELQYQVDQIVKVLEQGQKSRDKLTEPRWRAAYDLAMGRAYALRARAVGYNIMLAQMKVNPKSFTKDGNNTWSLVAAESIETGPGVKKDIKKATEYLSRVIDDHTGTPWEYLAAREIEQKMSWGWKESNTNYAAMGQGNNNNEVNRVLFLEETDPKTGKKKLVRRVKPNL